jgi:hypothetical protein
VLALVLNGNDFWEEEGRVMDAIPDFLNRKLNPTSQATVEERREYAARTPVQEQVEQRYSTIAPEDEAVLEALEQEKKAATARRIDKMKAKKAAKDQTKGIPDQYLSWDAKTLRFYDVRVRASRKLVAAFKRQGLPTPPADYYPRIQPFPWEERAEKKMSKKAA